MRPPIQEVRTGTNVTAFRSQQLEAVPPVQAAPFIDINGVSLTYGADDKSVLALHDFSLQVRKGEFAAIVGPSGCGKSTFLKLASGLRRPTAGTIKVADQLVDKPVKIVGMAFQNPALMPWRTCLENVMLPFEVVRSHRERKGADYPVQRERAVTILASVGLADAISLYPSQLSGGMQQRVALCRSLVHEPELLLVDEPFSALDAFTREELWDVLQGLHTQRRFTAVLVTHDLTEAVYLADTVHVLSSRPGRVIHSEQIGFHRPRTPRDRFVPAFAEAVLSLRSKIGAARGRGA
jgi:NitT/TauT family transport system ATP-binding protein